MDREPVYKALAVIKTKDASGLDESGKGRGGEK